jgi:hypothetical protein
MNRITFSTPDGDVALEATKNASTLTLKGPELACDRMLRDYPGLAGDCIQIDPEHYEVNKETLAQVAQRIVYVLAAEKS